MGKSMAEVGIKVNTTTNQRLLDGRGIPRQPKNRRFAFRWPERDSPDRCRRPSSPFVDGRRRGVFSEKALLKNIF